MKQTSMPPVPAFPPCLADSECLWNSVFSGSSPSTTLSCLICKEHMKKLSIALQHTLKCARRGRVDVIFVATRGMWGVLSYYKHTPTPTHKKTHSRGKRCGSCLPFVLWKVWWDVIMGVRGGCLIPDISLSRLKDKNVYYKYQ